MVDYVETLFNTAKDAGAQIEGIGKFHRISETGYKLM